MAKTFSGKETVKVLCQNFGFVFISQRGSHVKLRRRMGERTMTTIVPMHKELARGTLLGVLEMAEVAEDDFRSAA
ncbi:MAG: hypothetical protein A2945_02130 [Candidatus Liptonbacteria bacterium RIFCSPLOWO2_01_FULL_52_25]|uniref:Addiction module toxin, HicA family n=1 Tax=Candidatus Liptonbacteria bacterium RIFCSPLOWO2_01_FULL_52_25 TaxID=1798650 RepID=A0A1G2CEE6_9BACT|nr:MAG: hypothetical protein A2945_02130 [Candidatus Liptonbacteria bacterium RIFCSPLOWO2_01_FULL_52_25]